MAPDPKLLQEIQSRGFAVVPDVASREECAELRSLLQQCIDDDLKAWEGRHYPDSWMVLNLMTRGVPFARLLENSALQEYVAPMLGEHFIVYAYTSSSMPPRGANYSSRVHVDCPRFIPGYWTNMGFLLALDDFTAESGATYFLPGSHLSDAVPTDEEFFAKAERVYPKVGDAVFFSARTWHFGAKNVTDRARHALSMNLCRSYMRSRFDYPRMVDAGTLEHLGPVGRRMLGFNVRMPSSLAEYYVPEGQRLYKSNQE